MNVNIISKRHYCTLKGNYYTNISLSLTLFGLWIWSLFTHTGHEAGTHTLTYLFTPRGNLSLASSSIDMFLGVGRKVKKWKKPTRISEDHCTQTPHRPELRIEPVIKQLQLWRGNATCSASVNPSQCNLFTTKMCRVYSEIYRQIYVNWDLTVQRALY